MRDWRQVTRRDFARDSALGALVVGLGATAPLGSFAAAGDKSIVALVRDEKVLGEGNAVNADALKKMLDEAVKTATGESSAEAAWKKLVKPADVVGIIWSSAIAPTHKELIDAVTECCKNAGLAADKVVAVKARDKATVEKCTALITMPGLKTHQLTGIGTVMKNYITFGAKAAREYHQDNNVALGEIWLEPIIKGKTRLILIDAIEPAYAQGPQKAPASKWVYNGLIASTDPVAAETIALKILQAKRKAVKGEEWAIAPAPLCVAAADEKYKLGTSDMAKIALKIIGSEKDVLVSA